MKIVKSTSGILSLALTVFFLGQHLQSAAQLNIDGQPHKVFYIGSFEDRILPNDPSVIKITFSLEGADGGKATVNSGVFIPFVGFEAVHSCTSGGGAGAFVVATYKVGTGIDQIPPGSTIRFVVGKKGDSGSDDISIVPGTGSEYGGGGGGTAILFRPPNGSWTLLAVAGGGGGAYQGMLANVCTGLGDVGGAGRSGENAGSGTGVGGGAGGTGGNGGWSNLIYLAGGGGGGALQAGIGVQCFNLEEIEVGDAGEGGAGDIHGGYGGNSEGCNSILAEWRNGGFGFGGGGAGTGSGGGGGGYSGGGAGGLIGSGGGGGTYTSPIRESGTTSQGGSTEVPEDGSVTYQVTLNQPPVALCKNATVYLDANGNASIVSSTINNGSSDPEGLALTFGLSKSNFTCADVGPNNVTLTVTDNYGASSTCVAVVTVVDNSSPVITSVTPSKTYLWPPNHQMQAVSVAIVSGDNCSLGCRIISVTSNEPISGQGDGDTSPDWQITGNTTVNLRAERAPSGTGRIYTITAECSDASGNKSQATTTVEVPHDIRLLSAQPGSKGGETVTTGILELTAYPNPSNKQFTLQVRSNDLSSRISLEVFDQYGRVVERRDNLVSGSVMQFGKTYKPGAYYVRIMQGKEHSETKLVKIAD